MKTTIAAVALFVLLTACADKESKGRQNERPAQAPAKVSLTEEGNPAVTLDKASQARAGIRAEAMVMAKMQPELVAYGRLEEDPASSFVVRAPIAGILRSTGGDWPAVGRKLPDGAAIGNVEPRFTPTDRTSLTAQLATARSELSASAASIVSARAAYERARLLNADNKNVADRVVQEAEARLKAEEARNKAATDTVQLIESSLRSMGPAASRQVIAERGGDVVEALAQPGESIEQGAPILRLVNLDRLLARVDVPVGQRLPAGAVTARIVPVGYEDQPPLPATRRAIAVSDPAAQGASFLFQLGGSRFGLRPGGAVTAYVNLPGPQRQGVVIPRAAVIRTAGRTFVYVQVTEEQFVRKPVPVDDPVPGGYFVGSGISAGDRVVTVGAETVLSEEFKSQMRVEEGT